MTTIHRLIREILAEDRAGFKSRTRGISYNRIYGDSAMDSANVSFSEDPFLDTSPLVKKAAKDVKSAWKAEADHEKARFH